MEFAEAVSEIRQRFGAPERARLSRILTRASADCEVPMVTLGTGAQSTRKRALVVQMALDGEPLEAIAEAASLLPARVSQILSNVAELRFPALYPTFSECPNGEGSPALQALWDLMLPVLKQTPESQGFRADAWGPAALLDFLILQGKLDDSSISEIKYTADRWVRYSSDRPVLYEKKKKYLPLFGKWKLPVSEETVETPLHYGSDESSYRSVIATQQSPRNLVFGFLIGFGMLVWAYYKGGWYQLLYLLGVLIIYSAIRTSRRVYAERKLARAMFGAAASVKRSAPAAASKESNATGASEAIAGRLPDIVIRHANTLPPTAWNVNAISETSNAVGSSPVPIVYLWVFQAHFSEQSVYETHGWPQTGPVHMLLNGSAMPSTEAINEAMKNLVRDRDGVAKAVATFEDGVGTYPRPGLFLGDPGIGSKTGHYRGYPIHTLVCTNEAWRDAFHACAERSHFAVFNLSGYLPGHPGIEYEVAQVLRDGKPQHFVFIYDRHTDADAAIDSVLRVWQRLPERESGTDVLVFLRYQDGQIAGYGHQFGEFAKSFDRYRKTEGEYHPIAAAVIETVRSLQKERVGQ